MTKIVYDNIDDNDDIITKLGNGFSLTWNRSSNEIVHFNKNEEDEIVLDQHRENIVFVEKLNKQYFMTIAKDNIIKIWKTNGDLYTSFEKHDSKILGIKILDNKILSISENDSIRLWNFKGKEIFKIIIDVDSLKNIEIWSSDSIHILCNDELKIFSIDNGTEIITFEQQSVFIDDFTRLHSKNILTLSNDIITLWDSTGKKLNTIDLKFNFSHILELENNQIAVLTNDKAICMIDGKGEIISSYLEDDDFIKNFHKFIESSDALTHSKKERTDIKQFPHICNPSGKVIPNTIEEIAEQGLDLEKNNNRIMWDFFNRPLFTPIRKLLKKEENATKRFRKSLISLKEERENLLQSNEELLKKTKTAKTIMLVLFFISIIAGAGAGYFVDTMAYSIFALSLLLIIQVISKGKKISELESLIIQLNKSIITIDTIFSETNNFINNTQLYRASLLKQFPIIKDNKLFNGKEVNKIIKDLLDNSIHKVAMEECGLTQEDIIHTEGRAIILNDWSQIQNNTNKVNKHNISSFWGVSQGIVFATQFIQYIFLTKDKIDVFNTHYDFIQNKYIRKEAHAFYYKDVTNITKKEVDRELMQANEESSATEITLKVSSGDSIEVTIFNSETFSKLNSEIKNQNEEEDTTIEELEKDRLEIENDDSYSEEEKKEELDFIDGQIEDLKSKKYISNNEYVETNKVDATIQNIRAQIKIHK
jgi:F0F1-type ATP synthase assembly protein I